MTSDASDFRYTSATVPDGALFVEADEPLLVYPSVAAAERHLEAVDVENGVYPAAYGPHGEIYHIGTDGRRVVIERVDETGNPDKLRVLLLQYLEARGLAADPIASVADLVAEVWAIESDFWSTHDPYGDRFGSRIPLWGCVAFVLALAATLYFVFS